MEIITGVERRRRWSVDEKLRILAEIDRPGASVASVARLHDISRGLLWHWRTRFRNSSVIAPPVNGSAFVPVRLLAGPAEHEVSTASGSAGIEIVFPDSVRMIVSPGVNLDLLGRVLSALRG